MMKMKYVAASMLALSSMSAFAVDLQKNDTINMATGVELTITGGVKTGWQAKSYTAALGKSDLTKFVSNGATTTGKLDVAVAAPLFMLAMESAASAQHVRAAPKIEYQDKDGNTLNMTWDDTAKEGTLTLPAAMDTGGQTFTLTAKFQPVGIARVINMAESTYLDVPLHLAGSSDNPVFQGIACNDCQLPLADTALASDLMTHLQAVDIAGLAEDSQATFAKAKLTKTNVGPQAQDSDVLVEGADKSYTVADSKLMAGAGLVLKAGEVQFSSTQSFKAGTWKAPLTVVVSDL
ncbi:hypothetical protein RA180_21510 [Aeromonas salmonicida]|uniref:hypothetical protein n=1 Tax=Aeromonas salmonicida TaxID=645 RepID=UPI0027966D20|nr:hypothetical protein [Aeromonas salmonicida]MDQ1886570.1 hypothetical protein [Aeromonas salmonicida]